MNLLRQTLNCYRTSSKSIYIHFPKFFLDSYYIFLLLLKSFYRRRVIETFLNKRNQSEFVKVAKNKTNNKNFKSHRNVVNFPPNLPALSIHNSICRYVYVILL